MCDAMVAAAIERYGRIDVLYNNAAVQMSGRLVDCTDADWDLTIATNLSAIFWACRAALPHLLEGDGGSIINTASTLGLIGSEGYAAYGAAKAGLVLLTKQIAVEYGPSVRANVIAPGSIDTPRFRKVLEKTPGAEQFVAGLKRTIPVAAARARRGRRRRSRCSSRATCRRTSAVPCCPPTAAWRCIDDGTARTGGWRSSPAARPGSVRRSHTGSQPRAQRSWSRDIDGPARADRRRRDRGAGSQRGRGHLRRAGCRRTSRRWSAEAASLGRLGVLVLSAAVESFTPVVDLSDDEWQHVLDVNLKGPFLVMRAAIPHMVERRRLGDRARLDPRAHRRTRASRLLREQGRAA